MHTLASLRGILNEIPESSRLGFPGVVLTDHAAAFTNSYVVGVSYKHAFISLSCLPLFRYYHSVKDNTQNIGFLNAGVNSPIVVCIHYILSCMLKPNLSYCLTFFGSLTQQRLCNISSVIAHTAWSLSVGSSGATTPAGMNLVQANCTLVCG